MRDDGRPEPEAWLEADDVSYQIEDQGTWQDWLSMADTVVDDTGE